MILLPLSAVHTSNGEGIIALFSLCPSKMIFADEPTGALNQQNSKEVMKELIRINAEGTTVMLVTHDMKVAAKCDRVLYIEDGNIKGEIFAENCENGMKFCIVFQM